MSVRVHPPHLRHGDGHIAAGTQADHPAALGCIAADHARHLDQLPIKLAGTVQQRVVQGKREAPWRLPALMVDLGCP